MHPIYFLPKPLYRSKNYPLPMKYREINDWEIDYENELVLLKKDGKVVDYLEIAELVENWLEDMANQEFGAIEEEEEA